MSRYHHSERHRSQHINWLRAAVLGANDGIVSTASLVLGVAAAHTEHHAILVAGVAGLVAGSMSMAAGEYVSVSSQRDTEHADIERERGELAADEAHEREELAAIYVGRGLDADLANQVSVQLMARDALAAHARDELGISEMFSARPWQAAWTSALSFAVGAALPLLIVALMPANLESQSEMILPVAGGSLICLATLGVLAANTGGAKVGAGALRITFWGAMAMAITTTVGALFGTVL